MAHRRFRTPCGPNHVFNLCSILHLKTEKVQTQPSPCPGQCEALRCILTGILVAPMVHLFGWTLSFDWLSLKITDLGWIEKISGEWLASFLRHLRAFFQSEVGRKRGGVFAILLNFYAPGRNNRPKVDRWLSERARRCIFFVKSLYWILELIMINKTCICLTQIAKTLG